MAIIERDVVLMGKTEEGDNTLDMPITRLGNVEDDAEIKEAPEENDYVAVIDMSDNGQMKKTPVSAIKPPMATREENGLMSAVDKTKLDGITEGANNYSLPLAAASVRGGAKIGYAANGKNYPVQLSNEQMYVNVPWTDTNTTYANMSAATASAAGKAGLVPAPEAGAQTKYLRGDGTWQTPPDTNTTYSNMTAATASKAGNAGLVPAPAAGAQTKYLRGDGTWQTPPDTNTTYSNMTAATASKAGNAGLVPAPAAGAQTKYLRGDGTWQTPPDTNTTYSNMTGATTSAAGNAGLVPAPAAGAATRYLRSDGTWQVPPNTTYSAATASKAGLMSAADKKKLDGIETSIVTCGTIATIISGSGSSTHSSDNSVTIPHKTDLIIVNYTDTVNSYATLVSQTLNSTKTSCGLGSITTFTASFGTSSATLTIKGSGGTGSGTYTAIKLT